MKTFHRILLVILIVAIILLGVGISYLVNTSHVTAIKGTLVDAWTKNGDNNDYDIIEKLQYHTKETCLVS